MGFLTQTSQVYWQHACQIWIVLFGVVGKEEPKSA